MVPALFVALQEMPTNAHGKTDRNAVAHLPLPQVASDVSRYDTVLTSEMEGQL